MTVRQRARGIALQATASLRARPTFLVIGAQKAGTNSLHHYLDGQGAVLCATPKEVHYFNVNYALGDAWYLAHFPLRSRARAVGRQRDLDPAVGELTPGYLFHPLVPERVHAFDPELKLVAVLRDPVDRAYSQYNMQVRLGGETVSFERALELEALELPGELGRLLEDPSYVSPSGLRRSYVARGRYAEQLERWLALFPREQLLVLTSDELWSDPGRALLRMLAFLGIPASEPERYPHRSAGGYEPMSPETRAYLSQVFEPHNRRLEALLGRALPWTRPETLARAASDAAQAVDATS